MSEGNGDRNLGMLSFAAWSLIHIIGHTARFKVIGYERVTELVESGKGFILAVWHGRTLLPVHYCRGMGIWAITSLSRDGELQTKIVSRFGYLTIRGSTGKGAIRAALAACKRLEQGGILAITPDGPKGPANEVQPGIIFMAQRAGCPIIPIGVGARPRRLMRAWDEYLLPLPFAKCALVFGEPLEFKKDEPIEPYQDLLKKSLDEIQAQAQLMVEEG